MIDLSKKRLYEIKMPEGNILHIKKPSQKIYTRLIKMYSDDLDGVDTLAEFYELIKDILNLNTDNKIYDTDYVTSFDLSTLTLILQDYFTFVNEELGE